MISDSLISRWLGSFSYIVSIFKSSLESRYYWLRRELTVELSPGSIDFGENPEVGVTGVISRSSSIRAFYFFLARKLAALAALMATIPLAFLCMSSWLRVLNLFGISLAYGLKGFCFLIMLSGSR